jgi:DNA invertase Pin-like site-specific DNA recombinase
MAKIGYARVSTRSQKDDSQVDDLTAYGCDKIFTDTVSGKLAARPELDKALAYLREGDVLVITRLSRAMRSLRHLLALADELRERGAGLVVLKQRIDTTTPTGRLVFHILGAIDEFQRELIIEGTREGLDAARARGRTGGRKPKLSAAKAVTVRRMYQATGPDGKRLHTVTGRPPRAAPPQHRHRRGDRAARRRRRPGRTPARRALPAPTPAPARPRRRQRAAVLTRHRRPAAESPS